MGTSEDEGVVHMQEVASQGTVTCRTLSKINSIEVVFPSSFHLLYYSMYKKYVGSKCKEYEEANWQELVIDLRNKVMYSNRMFEFDQHLQYFEVICVDILSFIDYVHKT